MAVGAHKTAHLVSAAMPECAVALLVTAEADGIVLFCSPAIILGPERDNPADAAPAAGLNVRRTGTMTILAIELALLRLADPAHERVAERFGLARMAGHANLCTDICGLDRSAWLRSPRDRTIARCRPFRCSRRLCRGTPSTQEVEQIVSLGQFRQVRG